MLKCSLWMNLMARARLARTFAAARAFDAASALRCRGNQICRTHVESEIKGHFNA